MPRLLFRNKAGYQQSGHARIRPFFAKLFLEGGRFLRLRGIVEARAGSGRLFALLEPFTRSPEFAFENRVWPKTLSRQAHSQKPVIAHNSRLAVPIKNTRKFF